MAATLTIKEACAAVWVSRQTLYNWRKARLIRFYYDDRHRPRLDEEELRAAHYRFPIIDRVQKTLRANKRKTKRTT